MDSSSVSSEVDLTPLVEPFAWVALLRRDQMLAREIHIIAPTRCSH